MFPRVLQGVLIASLALSTSAQRTRTTPPPPPNVLLIVLDDLGTDKLEFYGQTTPTCPSAPCQDPPNCTPLPGNCVTAYPATPNLDALRRGGIWFERAYAMPVCSPTRACIQTGRYGFRTGIGNATNTVTLPGDYVLPDNEKLLAELLRDGFRGPARAGLPYTSGAFGKWHLATALDQDYGHAVANGYQRFYGSVGNVNSQFHYTQVRHDAGSAPVAVDIDGRFTLPPFGTDTWQASVTTQDTLDWIEAQTGSFLAYVGYGPPHTPVQVPPIALLPSETVCELTCAGLEPGDVLAPSSDPPELLKLVYRAQLEAMDQEVGNLIQGLDPRTRENTMIFVIGDNGTPGFVVDDPPHEDQHGKGQVHELGTRVPLIVSGPLVPPPPTNDGWQSTALVSAVDLFLTIAEVAGVNVAQVVPPSQLDSVSFLPVILDPQSAGNRTRVFTQIFSPNGIQPLPPPSCYSLNRRGLSDGEYKYIRIQEALSTTPCGTPIYSEQLYHLPTDPEELNELIAAGLTLEAAARLALLSAEMDTLSGH